MPWIFTQTKGWWALVNVHESPWIFPIMLEWHTQKFMKIPGNFIKIPNVILSSRIFTNVHEISKIFMKNSPKFHNVSSTFMNFNEDSWTFSPGFNHHDSMVVIRSDLHWRSWVLHKHGTLRHMKWTPALYYIVSQANVALLLHLHYFLQGSSRLEVMQPG